MTLEKYIILNSEYQKLPGSCQLLLSQLAKFGTAAALKGFQDAEIECAYAFLSSLAYESQWGGELYAEIQKLLHFLYAYLEEKHKPNGFVLVFVLMVVMMMSLLVIALYTLVLVENVRVKNEYNTIQSFQYAEGGLDMAMAVTKGIGKRTEAADLTEALQPNAFREVKFTAKDDVKLTVYAEDNYDDAEGDDPARDRDCRVVLHSIAIFPVHYKRPIKTELAIRTYPKETDDEEMDCSKNFYFHNWEQVLPRRLVQHRR